MKRPKKILRKIGLGFVAVFVAIQFIRSEKNVPAPGGPDDIMTLHSPPPEVRRILEVACYDCHSNNTHYPWYAEIQPVGWWLASHIADGQQELNFSTFGRLTPKKAKGRLEACIFQLEEHDMPLASYTLIHREAKLNAEQIKAFTAWAEAIIDELEDAAEKAGGEAKSSRK